MGFLFSKPKPAPTPQPKKDDFSVEVLNMLQKFNTKYPELKPVLSSSNSLTAEEKKNFDNEGYSFLQQVPVPTEESLYAFLIKQIQKYNIKIRPTDEKVQNLLIEYSKKYGYMYEYLDRVKTLPTDTQVEANKIVHDFLELYPLGSLNDFYKLQISLLKKYNLPVPPEEGFSSGETIKSINYSKISLKMESVNGNFFEKQYAPFSR